MTDAKEPEVITQLLHSEECGRSLLYDVYGNELCSIAAILNHIDTLTRKLNALTLHMNQVHATLGGTDTVLTLEAAQHVVFERDEARTVTDAMVERAAKALYEHATPYFWRLASQDTLYDIREIARAALTAAFTPEDA
jgi:hypothetical protein